MTRSSRWSWGCRTTWSSAPRGSWPSTSAPRSFADGIRLDFVCGDEVYGACTQLREFFEDRGQAYVLRVPSNFRLTLARGVTADLRAGGHPRC